MQIFTNKYTDFGTFLEYDHSRKFWDLMYDFRTVKDRNFITDEYIGHKY